MTPLNLAQSPPRPPHAALDGCLFLPRSIDKVRATFAGGDCGPYVVAGLTQMLLDTLGVPLAEFTLAVRDAATDEDVAAFLRERTTQAKYEAWNALVLARQPRNGDRAAALVAYPWLANRPDLVGVLDVLTEDDKQHFAATP